MRDQAELEAIRDDKSKPMPERIEAANELIAIVRAARPEIERADPMSVAGLLAEARAVAMPRWLEDAARDGFSDVEEHQRHREEEASRKAAERQRAQERNRLCSLLESSGPALDDDDAQRIVDGNYSQTIATGHVEAWVADANARKPGTPRILVLCGSVGTGKTFAAAVALAKMGHGVCLRASRLHIALDPWRGEAREDDHRISPETHSFVCLDDLGTERDPKDPRWAEAFFELVDARMERGRWTLITSNVPRAKFRERYDVRVIDRLNHAARVVEIAGASMRRKAGGL